MEQVYMAHDVVQCGFDVFYEANQIYVMRQVVTNSKGQKVELFFNAQAFEDMSLLPVGFAPVLECMDYHWEIFLWADTALKVTNDLDLVVPNTYYEYQKEWSTEVVISWTQMNIPEDIRPYDTGRNPHCRAELWKSQEQLQLEKEMLDPEWKLPQN